MNVPLKAIVTIETIIGPDLSQEEWTTLKSRHKKGLTITMGCCGAPGHLRIFKKRDPRHFYHPVETGCKYEPASREYRKIKYPGFYLASSSTFIPPVSPQGAKLYMNAMTAPARNPKKNPKTTLMQNVIMPELTPRTTSAGIAEDGSILRATIIPLTVPIIIPMTAPNCATLVTPSFFTKYVEVTILSKLPLLFHSGQL
jgi:hypothetical protein